MAIKGWCPISQKWDIYQSLISHHPILGVEIYNILCENWRNLPRLGESLRSLDKESSAWTLQPSWLKMAKVYFLPLICSKNNWKDMSILMEKHKPTGKNFHILPGVIQFTNHHPWPSPNGTRLAPCWDLPQKKWSPNHCGSGKDPEPSSPAATPPDKMDVEPTGTRKFWRTRVRRSHAEKFHRAGLANDREKTATNGGTSSPAASLMVPSPLMSNFLNADAMAACSSSSSPEPMGENLHTKYTEDV